MALVKSGVSDLPIPAKIQFARQVVTDMTGNPNFTTPAPTLASVGAAATSLETAFNAAETARQIAKSKTTTMDTMNAALNGLMSLLANYVQQASGGDEAKIETSGFSVRDLPASPIGNLPAPTLLAVSENGGAGSVKLKWKTVRGNKGYIVEIAPDAPTPVWGPAGGSSKARAEVNGLTSGTKYWFRVCAIGSNGLSPWSALVSKFAP